MVSSFGFVSAEMRNDYPTLLERKISPVLTKMCEVEALLLLALMTGMRRGELMSLQWKDIDLEQKCLHVRHTVAPISG